MKLLSMPRPAAHRGSGARGSETVDKGVRVLVPQSGMRTGTAVSAVAGFGKPLVSEQDCEQGNGQADQEAHEPG